MVAYLLLLRRLPVRSGRMSRNSLMYDHVIRLDDIERQDLTLNDKALDELDVLAILFRRLLHLTDNLVNQTTGFTFITEQANAQIERAADLVEHVAVATAGVPGSRMNRVADLESRPVLD